MRTVSSTGWDAKEERAGQPNWAWSPAVHMPPPCLPIALGFRNPPCFTLSFSLSCPDLSYLPVGRQAFHSQLLPLQPLVFLHSATPRGSPPGNTSLPLPVATHIGVLRVQSEGGLQKGDNKEAHHGRCHQALCERTEKKAAYSDFVLQPLFGAKTNPPSKWIKRH